MAVNKLREKIRAKLESLKYENYVVTDIGNFPWMVPGTAKGKEAYKRYDGWMNNTVHAHQALQFNQTFKAKTFTNATQQITKAKAAECSNFAYHAIGVLLEDPSVTRQYNICLAGIMSGRHNIVILFPKDYVFNPDDIKNKKWPQGTLVVDPWAVGMGQDADRALAVPMNDFVYKDSVKADTQIHYQSKNDNTLQFDDGFSKMKEINEQVKNSFDSSKFDIYLEQIKQKTLNLESRGYDTAYDSAKQLYNNLVNERNKFVTQEPTAQIKSDFVANCTTLIENAQKSELAHFRGFKKILPLVINALAFLCTFSLLKDPIKTASINKVMELKTSLNQLKNTTEEQIEIPRLPNGPA
jgi:hypothetical protein